MKLLIVNMTDTHTHLTEEPLISSLDDVLARAYANGVERFIVPGYNPDSWVRARELAAYHKNIFQAVGLHPMFVNEENRSAFEKQIEKGNIVAIGEIGLDYYIPGTDSQKQKEIFKYQLKTAFEAQLPVILHCRKAYDDLLNICRDHLGVRGVIHSCSCSHEQVKPFLDMGLYVAFSGVVTRMHSKKAKKLAEFVPLDKIIVETDSPFIGTDNHPVPSVEPAHLREVISAIANIRKIEEKEIMEIVEENANRLFFKS